MSIEIDIQVCCNEQDKHIVNRLSNNLPKDYIIIMRGKTKKNIYISFDNYIKKTLGLDEAIASFLINLMHLKDEIAQFNATLQIGLFYKVSETVVCPVLLNKKTIDLIYQFNLNLDITGYPCDDTEENP